MRYIDKVIKGEGPFNAFMHKFRPGWDKLPRYENCWTLWDVHVERFYEKGPNDDNYNVYFWLIMPSNDPDKGFCDWSQRRLEIYEGIRSGRITG